MHTQKQKRNGNNQFYMLHIRFIYDYLYGNGMVYGRHLIDLLYMYENQKYIR